MINFIEYVVSELKSKRLSKENALSVIKQFTFRSASAIKASGIHPLLHSNTSDLSQQSYTSTFNGEEFFLQDHQVNGQKILPGVAYIEMIRAAIEKAMPSQRESAIIEIKNLVWAKPIMVTEEKDVTISLFASEKEITNGQVNYEIYSIETDIDGRQRETINCQGKAIFVDKPKDIKLDIGQLKIQMDKGIINDAEIYLAYKKMGVDFGPAHQALKEVYKGEEQALAKLTLPMSVNDTFDEYFLHPSLMDGSLQAPIGLIKDANNLPIHPALPFALESLRIIYRGKKEMYAWVRYSKGSNQEDKISRLDIDLCDLDGTVCVQMRGFSSRVFNGVENSERKRENSTGLLLATPVWESSKTNELIETNRINYAQRHIIIYDIANMDAKKIETSIKESHCYQFPRLPQKNLAECYSEIALNCFELVQKILKDKPQGKVFLQLVVKNDKESELFVGLSGLLKTVTLENPLITGQIILVNPQIIVNELIAVLEENVNQPEDAIVKYEHSTRSVLRLQEKNEIFGKTNIAFKDNGVYIVSGGLGGLGVLFAKEIIKQTNQAKIILVGRSALTENKKAILENLTASKNLVEYRELDITNQSEVKRFISQIKDKHHQINGILHCAGVISDNFILKKTSEEFSKVLAPKITGTFNLDQASQDIDLDFMILFSSVVSITGNNGQCDYAAANGFMDKFSYYRNQLVTEKKRHGRTVSINWPLWMEGGMKLDRESMDILQQYSGMYPMQTQTGMESFQKILSIQNDQILVVEGEITKLHQTFLSKKSEISASSLPTPIHEELTIITEIEEKSLVEKTQEYIRKQFADIIKLASNKIDPQAPLEKYGIDSILAMNLTTQLEKTFGTLSKTLLFEYQTIRELTDYFVKSHSAKLMSLFNAINKQKGNHALPQIIEPVLSIDTQNEQTDPEIENKSIEEKTEDYIKKQLSDIIKLPSHKIDSQAPLEKYGIDSILAMNLTSQLEKTFGVLSKTLFFEYQTIHELTKYFVNSHNKTLTALFSSMTGNQIRTKHTSILSVATHSAKSDDSSKRVFSRYRQYDNYRIKENSANVEPIAIVGLSGRYPKANNIQEYWYNLRDGKDCIIEVPKERWDWRKYHSTDRSKKGHHYSKWGGFIDGVDEFDPRFFNISPREAMMMDPQERLFLQHAWMAIEDAGYTRTSMQIPHENDMAGQVGVYVGVMYSEYQLFGIEASARGKRMGIGGSYASIANRVSYLLNLHGPSITLDTMCSSSLTAIHSACQDLKYGRTDLAIAGGVNVSIHPNKYLVISAGQFISSDGHCQSFGEGGDGYIPGEGVGAIILKRLSDANRDGNHIYGIIKGSALNHGGKTNGYSVPNPHAQASVINRALRESNLNPRHISYIEAHGTGTRLGDPIEITALSQAFSNYTKDTGFCLIGSAKSNIGHCESAAGIAGLTKVLLQMKYHQIVPSLHSKVLNPHIDFDETPFVVNQTLRPWNQPVIDGQQLPRIAGISSFGAGGSNAHILIQEYVSSEEDSKPIISNQHNPEVIIPLSARTNDQLKQKARDLISFIQSDESKGKSTEPVKSIDLIAMAYTLQVGREALDERLGLIVNSVEQLTEKLQAYVNDKQDLADVYQGHVEHDKNPLSLFNIDNDLQQTVDKWVLQKKLSQILDLWVKGLNLDWNKLYANGKPPFMSLPTYPFARERYWIQTEGEEQVVLKEKVTSVLHPLLHTNTSDLNQVSYSSIFSGDEKYLLNYQNNSNNESRNKMLPTAAYFEMALVAAKRAISFRGESSVFEFHNIVWGQPFVLKSDKQITVAILADDSNKIEYEIFSQEDEKEVVHCQGQVAQCEKHESLKIDIDNIKMQVGENKLDTALLYQIFSDMGLNYGPAYQGITSVYKGMNQLLAQLTLPIVVETDYNEFFLHPSLIDGMMQASMSLLMNFNQEKTDAYLPYALEELHIKMKPAKQMFIWVHYSQELQTNDGHFKLDVDLCDMQGNICIQMKELCLQRIVINTDYQSINELSVPEDRINSPKAVTNKPQSIQLNDMNESLYISGTVGSVKQKTINLNSSQETNAISNTLFTPSSKPSTDLIPTEDVLEINKSQKTYSQEQLQEQLKISLGQALYLKPSEIDIDKSFVDLGLDSIIGVEWVKEINKQYGMSISATKVYDYVNIKSLSKYLKDEIEKSPNSTIKETITNKEKVFEPVSKITKKIDLQEVTAVVTNRITPSAYFSQSLVNPSEEKSKENLLSYKVNSEISLEELQEQLRRSLGKSLYLESSEIDIGKSFNDLGLDSIIGVEWVKQINKQYGLEMSATKVYDYSNIKELAKFILKEFELLSGLPSKQIPMYSENSMIIDRPPNEKTSEYSQEQLLEQIRNSLSKALYLQPSEIDIEKSFVDLGLDSIVGVEWVKDINKEYGLELSATKVYDYSNLKALTSFLSKELEKQPRSISKQISSVIQNHDNQKRSFSKDNGSILIVNVIQSLKRKLHGIRTIHSNQVNANDKIAIIGMSGRYPQASNLQNYWENLVQGKNSIREIPKSRWDVSKYYDPDSTKAGKINCKWLGMVDDVDCFDPLFFQIPPAEAESMDPQHRLFLQESYKAFEDAGYCGNSLSNKKCGVYLGIMSNDYSYLINKSNKRTTNITGNSFAIGAGRVAYILNLKGPAIPFDTACSSSLVATHVACQSLLNHEIDMALAGGVSLYLIPEAYVGMCQAGMLSPDGQCKTFDDSANGFVPGDGVGALVLKRLQDAERDKDFIYGVILGSAINQDGKTNGITAPSVNSQIELERGLYSKYNINPETISYIEAHGTGTKLGDPIELEALSTVFKEKTSKRNFCALGSVKTNIGHTSGAAGVAGIQKVILSMQHKTIVPSLNITKENSIFDFKNSPFYISRESKYWDVDHETLRRACVSSFGFSGTNAHLVIEEYVPPKTSQSVLISSELFENMKVLVPLSAKTPEQLKQKAIDLLEYLRGSDQNKNDLVSMAYTLQVGREAMKERVCFIVSSLDDMKEKIQKYIDGEQNIKDTYQGKVSRDKDTLSMFGTDTDLQNIVDRWINEKKYLKIAGLWAKGLEVDWNKLYGDNKPSRISLPTYPFAKERFWIETEESDCDQRNFEEENKIETNQQIEEEISKIYYCPEWKETSISKINEKNNETGPILILDTTDELFKNIKEKFNGNASAVSLALLKIGHSFQEIEPNVFTVSPEQEDHFYKLIDNLKNKGQLPRQIIHQGSEIEKVEKSEDISRLLNCGIYPVFNICKALMVKKSQIPLQIISIFTNNAYINTSLNAAISGFFKTLTLENPKFLTKVIEIKRESGDLELSIEEKIKLLFEEFLDRDWNKNDIRYYFQKEKKIYSRSVKDLIQVNSFQSEDTNLNLPLKHKGVYIISGGLGGLGYIFSEFLAKNFQCKLVLFGRSAINAEQEEKINRLKSYKAEVLYIQADVSKLDDMLSVVRSAKERYSQINGVIHSAGVNKDSFILKKTKDEIEKVIEAKVYGTFNIDQATCEENLDLFILFSSIAGVMGNLGQCDYSYANHFIDSFAEEREFLRKGQKRFGKTLSINWPYWEEGGMVISQNDIALTKKHFGIIPLPTKVGLQCWEELIKSDFTQAIALYGFQTKINSYMEQTTDVIDKDKSAKSNHMDQAVLLQKTIECLKSIIGEEIKLSPERIDSRDRFESFGIDSIIVSRLNVNLERKLGNLPKTLFYEYETIEELATYLTTGHQNVLLQFFNCEYSKDESEVLKTVSREKKVEKEVFVQNKQIVEDNEQIAIIGIHGQFPHSGNLDEYWENLKAGKDMIDIIPPSRWDYNEFYHPDPEKATEGKIYCKWGGFLNNIDKFDPLFFNISPEDAKSMDPQERLFMQSVWAAIEDAGYTRESLKRIYPKAKSADVGVFAGVTTNSYQLLAPDEWSRGNIITPGTMYWSIANRVSYFFDFQGPSMPIDTACSSSLVAIHLACESLKRQECQVAIAGGVNLYLHPFKYQSFCRRRMLAQNGKCRSFGAGDDGFIPGEAIGSVVLKPLNKAIEDKDHIHGVILASAYDHCGKSNGYSAPNPNSQASLISTTLSKANVNPETIGYVEGHGTGTQLGDSLEIVSLTNAFQKYTMKKQFCAVGSVKANIGHPESAAGVAGLAKVLLQFKHQQLVPTINSKETNPNIDFKNTPFYLQHELTNWESSPDHPKRAIINSFGAGGVNACVILEEYKNSEENSQEKGPYLIVLSAKDKERLHEYADRLFLFLWKNESINIRDLSYTLQIGREAMQERLAIVASSIKELTSRLNDWITNKTSACTFQGSVDPKRKTNKNLKKDEEDRLMAVYEKRDFDKLAEIWATGVDIDWDKFYQKNKPIRITLPSYPFSKERYWITDNLIPQKRTALNQMGNQLHPLISYNSSTLRDVSFNSLLSDGEFYAKDHIVNGDKIFPGSGFLEIACVSGKLAGEKRVCKIQDVVWIKPLSFQNGSQMVQTFLKPMGNTIDFKITSLNDENERIVHSEGKLSLQNDSKNSEEKNIPIQTLKEKCSNIQNGVQFYEMFEDFGFKYGSSFKTVQEFYVNEDYALSKLKLADNLKLDFNQFILHPSLLDGALQTVAGLLGSMDSKIPYLPFAIDDLEICRQLTHTCYAYVEFADSQNQSQKEIKKFNIRLLNEKGNTLVVIKNFYVRALKDTMFADQNINKSAEMLEYSV